MAIYHFHATLIGRSTKGSATASSAYVSGSVVAGAAYRAGEKIYCKYDERTHDYTHKTGVIFSEIMLPENAPSEFIDRATLWNAVELKNNRKNAQLAREVDVSLPRELSHNEHIDTVREYIERNLTSKGICADYAIHDKRDGNPHVHILFTMDKVTEKGVGLRLDDEKDKNFFYQKQRLLKWREEWAFVCNKHLEKAGYSERIDHRSYVDRGIEKTPTVHMGKGTTQLEKQGIKTERGERNRQIINLNAEREKRKIIAQQEQAKQRELEKIARIKQEETERLAREQQVKISQAKALHGLMEQTKFNYVNTLDEITKLQEDNNAYWRSLWRTMQRNKSQLDDIAESRARITEIEQQIKENLYEKANLSIFKKKQKLLLEHEIKTLEREKAVIERQLEIKHHTSIDNISQLSSTLYHGYTEAYRAIYKDGKVTINGVEMRRNIHHEKISALRMEAQRKKNEYDNQRREFQKLNYELQRQQIQQRTQEIQMDYAPL